MKNRKIIICDDEVIISIDIAFILKQAGYNDVLVANSARSLVETANRILPDIIITDINLGESRSGIEAIEEIKKNGKEIDVIFVSGNAESYKSSIEEGKLVKILSKPFINSQLVETVENFAKIIYEEGNVQKNPQKKVKPA